MNDVKSAENGVQRNHNQTILKLNIDGHPAIGQTNIDQVRGKRTPRGRKTIRQKEINDG